MKTKITPHKEDLIINRITMKKFLFSIFLLFILVIVSSFSQVQQEWVQRYNGPGNSSDDAYAIAVDDSGNVYVTGRSYGSGTYFDYATIKYNSNGEQQWVQRYNGPGNYYDIPTSIAVDHSGNVYVTGQSRGISSGYYDYATIKYNANGIQQWVQRYGGPLNGEDDAHAIAVDGSGNVYVTGESQGNGTNYDFDYATIKYNTKGVQQWVQRYCAPSNRDDKAYSIAVDGLGNVYVTGTSIEIGWDYATVKYNTDGVQQWVERYNGPGNASDLAYSIAVDPLGNVYVTGCSSTSSTFINYATIKYNSIGEQKWVQRYAGPGNDDAGCSIAVDGLGNVYVTGVSLDSGTDYDYATIKYSASGGQQWVQRYDGPQSGYDFAYSIAVDAAGNVYVTGYCTGVGTGFDYATIKYNSNGEMKWEKRYKGPGNGSDRAFSIAVDGLGNVYVTGSSTGSGTGTDFATIKYSQYDGIKKISYEVPDRYSLYQNYPNPFNPSTKIKFEIPDFPLMKGVRGMSVRLTIYDLLGREVTTLVNEQLKPGTYEVEWDASNYSSGVYFYRLIVSDPSASSGQVFTEMKKMVLLK